MRFSIITPSFRNSKWLKLCIASVGDQGLESEHIVQDAGSDDGTLDWLPHDKRVRAFVEKDRGMYDAVNRGLRRASGDILSYINCDEQYVPGALRRVRDYFERHPKVEVLFADAIVVDPQGEYLCHRQACLPLRYHTLVSNNLAIMTCATFFRRSLIDRHNLFFNAGLKDVGDAEWIVRLIDRGLPMALLKGFTSIFTETGANMNLLPNAQLEKRGLFDSAPSWVQRATPLIVLHHRFRRLLACHYFPRKITYSLYTLQNSQARVAVEVPRSASTCRWKR